MNGPQEKTAMHSNAGRLPLGNYGTQEDEKLKSMKVVNRSELSRRGELTGKMSCASAPPQASIFLPRLLLSQRFMLSAFSLAFSATVPNSSLIMEPPPIRWGVCLGKMLYQIPRGNLS